MRIGTLFSGIGSPEQAASRVWPEHKIAFACEWDKYARQSYLANYDIDEVHFYTDVREMDGTKYQGKVDVLVWGFPCTSYSIAGKRLGMNDERTGDLFHQGLRILKECMPKYTIIENVKGLLSIDNGNTAKEFIQALRNAGYYCHYEIINSKDYGIPQNRERFFLVGFLDHEAYYRFQFAPKQPLNKRLKDVLEPNVDEKYYLSEIAIKGFQAHAERMAERGNGFKFEPTDGNTIASSVTTRAGGRPDDNYIKEPKIFDLTNDFGEEKTRKYTEFAPCLRSERFGLATEQNYRIRKLTPLECWRLQDFPDEAHEKAKAAGVSDTRRYQQAGNSMTVAVVEMIFRQIDKAFKKEHTGGLF